MLSATEARTYQTQALKLKLKRRKERESEEAYTIACELSNEFKKGVKKSTSKIYRSLNLIEITTALLIEQGFKVKILKGCRDYSCEVTENWPPIDTWNCIHTGEVNKIQHTPVYKLIITTQ